MKGVKFIFGFYRNQAVLDIELEKNSVKLPYFKYESMFTRSGFILWKSRGVLRADSIQMMILIG